MTRTALRPRSRTPYRQPSHMTRQFKESHNGISPSEWRNAIHSAVPMQPAAVITSFRTPPVLVAA